MLTKLFFQNFLMLYVKQLVIYSASSSDKFWKINNGLVPYAPIYCPTVETANFSILLLISSQNVKISKFSPRTYFALFNL